MVSYAACWLVTSVWYQGLKMISAILWTRNDNCRNYAPEAVDLDRAAPKDAAIRWSRRPCSVTVCLWCVCVRECSSQGRGREGGRGRVIEKNKPARKGRETDGAPLVWITSQPLYLRYISNSNEKVYFKSSLVLSTSLVRILWSFTSHFIATRRVKPLHTDIRKWNICRFKHKA